MEPELAAPGEPWEEPEEADAESPLVELLPELVEDEDPADPGLNVGLLDIALVLARLAEGNDAPGPRLVPRS